MQDEELTLQRVIAQDNHREEMMAAICGLRLEKSRMGKDAKDSFGNIFELKSSTKSNNTLSTARDVSLRTIVRWENQYWIAAKGQEYKLNIGKRFSISEMYLIHPHYLIDQFLPIKKKLNMREVIANEFQKLRAQSPVLSTSTIEKELKLFFIRAATLNDPKISFSAFKNGGIKLDHLHPKNAQEQLAKYVSDNPLHTSFRAIDNQLASEFFDFD